jgi:hypothetical protein
MAEPLVEGWEGSPEVTVNGVRQSVHNVTFCRKRRL